MARLPAAICERTTEGENRRRGGSSLRQTNPPHRVYRPKSLAAMLTAALRKVHLTSTPVVNERVCRREAPARDMRKNAEIQHVNQCPGVSALARDLEGALGVGERVLGVAEQPRRNRPPGQTCRADILTRFAPPLAGSHARSCFLGAGGFPFRDSRGARRREAD